MRRQVDSGGENDAMALSKRTSALTSCAAGRNRAAAALSCYVRDAVLGPSDHLAVRGHRKQHDHHKCHHESEAYEPYQKAHEEPSDLCKSRQPSQGCENEKEVEHPIHLPSVLIPPCRRVVVDTTQHLANVPT